MFTKTIDENVSLFTLQMHHAEECYRLIDANREHLGKWLAWVARTKCSEDVRSFFHSTRRWHAERGDVTAGVSYHGQFAGIVALNEVDSYHGTADINYWLGAEFQGKGIVTRACEVLLKHAYEDLGLNRIQINVAPANERSKAVPRRLGFHYEGTLRQVALFHSEYEDLEVYSLLKSEWFAQQKDGA